MNNPFYKLTQAELIQLAVELPKAALTILLYLKCENPWENRQIEIDCITMGEALGLNPRTVTRMLRLLESGGYIGELEIRSARLTVAPPKSGSKDPKSGSKDPKSGSKDPKSGSKDPQNGSFDPNDPPQTLINQGSDTLLDQLDQLRSSDPQEDEEKIDLKKIPPEYLQLLRRKAKALPEPPNCFQGWAAAAVKRGIYLEEWERLQQTQNVPAALPAVATEQGMTPAEYFAFINGRGGHDA